jgi:glycosyltransferase involved in cell wall biosynthesis
MSDTNFNLLPELSIVLPTKDRHPILFKTVRSILDSIDGIRCELFIIDNSTISDIQLPTELQGPFIQVLKNPGNRNSVFASRNYGASIARAKLLLFIDDDIIVNEKAIRFTIEHHANQEKTATNVAWTYPPDLINLMQKNAFGRYLIHAGFTSMRELYGLKRWKENTVFESGEVASFFLGIPKKLFDDTGGYEERHLHEGTDISLINNLHKNNVKMHINSSVIVYHNEEDRIDMHNWLERKKRVGEIHAYAEKIGEQKAHEMHYSSFRCIILPFIWSFRWLFLFLSGSLFSRMKFLDKFTFKLISALNEAYMYRGYSQGRKNQ